MNETQKTSDNIESLKLINVRIFKGLSKDSKIPYYFMGKKVQIKEGDKWVDKKDENGKSVYSTLYLHFNKGCVEGHQADMKKIEKKEKQIDFDYLLGYLVAYTDNEGNNTFAIRINDFKLK